MQVKIDSASCEDVHIWLLVCAQNSIPITPPSLPGLLLCLLWNWCLLLGYQSCRSRDALMTIMQPLSRYGAVPTVTPLCILYTILPSYFSQVPIRAAPSLMAYLSS